MKILAVDTASRTCSVAVLDGLQLVTEIILSRAQVHSRHLMEMIDNAFRYTDFPVSDIDGFAVTRGPGGFTGLRIGMSVVKGMALALDKPVAGIPTLDALAFPLRREAAHIVALLDARRGDVYAAEYRSENGRLISEGAPRAMKPEAVTAGIRQTCVFVGDGAEAYRNVIENILGDRARFADPERNIVRAETLARMALDRFQRGLTDDEAALTPLYVRKSDAELNLGRKTS